MKYLTFFLFAILLTACETQGNSIVIRTADPALSIFVPVPQSDLPVIAPDPAVVPSEEVGESEPEPPPTPPCIVVKGNISRDGRKLYHVEGMANFNTVRINEAAGERFFSSVEEAEAAGWVRAGN